MADNLGFSGGGGNWRQAGGYGQPGGYGGELEPSRVIDIQALTKAQAASSKAHQVVTVARPRAVSKAAGRRESIVRIARARSMSFGRSMAQCATRLKARRGV